jgi:hypothetical protein
MKSRVFSIISNVFLYREKIPSYNSIEKIFYLFLFKSKKNTSKSFSFNKKKFKQYHCRTLQQIKQIQHLTQLNRTESSVFFRVLGLFYNSKQNKNIYIPNEIP